MAAETQTLVIAGRMQTVRLTYEFPPIPCRNSDWAATLDTYDPERGDPIGRGATREAAIDDLEGWLEE